MSKSTANHSRLKGVPTTIRTKLKRTGSLSLGLLGRRDSLAVFSVVTVGYLFAFLYMLQDMFIETSAGFDVSVPVSDPLSIMFQRGPGLFAYEAIAVIEAGVITWTFSPLNTLIGLVLAVLVGFNLALTYLAVSQPKACGMGASSGLFASLPALLAGGTCCAPVIALVFGIQMSATLVTAFTWMLPIGAALLLLSLVYVSGKVDPTAV